MYERITGEDPYTVPMRIFPAPHYTMGGLWVDYNLQTTVPGLFALGECNFSDHGANRLGASALMQGLADGYFVAPYTVSNYLAGLLGQSPVPTDDPAFTLEVAAVADRTRHWLAVGGTKSVDYYHRELGKLVWDDCGMARNKEGLEKALTEIPALRGGVPQERPRPGQRHQSQSGVGAGGPGRRFHGAGRAEGPRRPSP